MSKKLIALLLALVFAVSCFPLGIFAAEPVAAAEEPAAPGAIIYVESTYCVIGKTVEVDICILNNPGVAGAKFSVSFDEGLTLVGASTDDGVFATLDYTAPNALQNGAPFNWDSLDAVATEDGKIITLTFEASENLTADEELAVTVSYKYGDIYDSALDSIAVTMVGGTLEVIDYVPGDADGDSVVTGKDVTQIRRYNADWDVDINLLAADVNGDGSVNGKDVTQIRRFLADWDVEFLPGYVACVHSVKAVEAKDPTCTEAGNVAYWLCSLCDACFSDAEAQNEISELETIIPATGHDANLHTPKNIAHPVSTIANPIYKLSDTAQKGDEFVFIYYLGYIDNIPLDSISGTYYHAGGEIEKELSTTTATADSISKVVADATENTRGWQSDVKIGSETTIGKDSWPVKEKITVEVSHNQSGSTTTSHEESTTTTISQEFVSAATDKRTWTNEDPRGWYRYVNYATVDVFAVIMYDAINSEYYVANINAVRDVGQMWDYSATSSSFDDCTCGELPFEIPDEVYEYVESLTACSEGMVFNAGVAVAYTGTDTDVVIPMYQNGTRVTAFDAGLFAGNTDITSVTFGEGITAIPDGAFEGCTSLVSVVFNGELTEIGANAFKGCAALEFEIPETVIEIGDSAFDGCIAMDSASIGESVTSLGAGVFNNCGDLSLTVNSRDLTVVQAAVSSGAPIVAVEWRGTSDVDANCTLVVPAVRVFNFNGNHQTFKNLWITSEADNTTVKYTTINNSSGETAMSISSPNVNLRAVTVTSNKTALTLTADTANLIIGETVTLTARNNCDGLTANNVTVSSATGEASTLTIYGGNGDGTGQGIEATDITFDGFLTVNVNGGAGNDGYNGNTTGACEKGASGGNGQKGAIAILAQEIVVNGHVSLTVTGGNGGRGGNGGNGWSGAVVGDSDGGRAGNGGDGGDAISANSITVLGGGCITATGGRGGDGGRGGNGAKWMLDNANGGEGGSGGSGGSSYNSSCIMVDEVGTSTFHSGANGSRGDNGSGT